MSWWERKKRFSLTGGQPPDPRGFIALVPIPETEKGEGRTCRPVSGLGPGSALGSVPTPLPYPPPSSNEV